MAIINQGFGKSLNAASIMPSLPGVSGIPNPQGFAFNRPESISTGSFNSSAVRLQQAGLNPNGSSLAPSQLTPRQIPVTVLTKFGETLSKLEDDWRVRISLSDSSTLFYQSEAGAGIQFPLKSTRGVIFPYTPAISVTHNANYGVTKLTHSNYAAYFYEGSEISAITISGDFTVQSIEEGKYLLAAVSFFRSCTKMFFGDQDNQIAGNPPPMVFLNGYGKYYFPNVPCVITNFTHTLPADVDYIEVSHYGNDVSPTSQSNNSGEFKAENELLSVAATRVPTSSTISISVQPVYSRKFVHENFNLNEFAKGSLLLGKGGFI